MKGNINDLIKQTKINIKKERKELLKLKVKFKNMKV